MTKKKQHNCWAYITKVILEALGNGLLYLVGGTMLLTLLWLIGTVVFMAAFPDDNLIFISGFKGMALYVPIVGIIWAFGYLISKLYKWAKRNS